MMFGVPFFCKSLTWSLIAIFGLMGAAWALDLQRIYRCGDSYSTQMVPQQNCKLLKTANVTVIDGASASKVLTAPVRSSEQRSLDGQAHAVLRFEFQKSQAQQVVLLHEWNNGEPERRADEFRQPQKYQNRVTELRLALQRVEADLAGLTREMSRVVPLSTNGVKP